MIQIWKVIKDYPMYSVSNLGSIKNNKTGRILRQLMIIMGTYKSVYTITEKLKHIKYINSCLKHLRVK